MTGKTAKERKSRTFNPRYEDPNYGYLAGFEHPFERELDATNRWVVLAKFIPRDEIRKAYLNKTGKRHLHAILSGLFGFHKWEAV